MIKRLAIVVLLFFSFSTSVGQFVSPERAALKHIQKKRWEKAEAQLRRALRKANTNALARYLFSVYFFKKENPSYHLDSAYRYAIYSYSDLKQATQKQLEKMRRFSIDSVKLITQREKIDSAAYAAAMAINTEKSYIRFLNYHPLAAQKEEAIKLRNEVAYQDAVRENTYTALLSFLNKYPQAARTSEARQKYDRLLYESLTKDKRLQTFENFLRLHPETPFRTEIEQNIFELTTLSGTVESYMLFIQRYADTDQVKKANNIVFHILQEKEDPNWPTMFLSDSLHNIRQLQDSYLVPFLKNGKFGFIDKHGREVIAPFIGDLKDDYKCGNVKEDVIVISNGLLARNGSIIYNGTVEEIDDLGTGFLKVKSGSCYTVVHKSGFIAAECVENAKVFGNRLISFLRNNKWSIHSFSGRKLLKEEWDEIDMLGNILVFKKAQNLHLVTFQQLLKAAEQQISLETDPFDEIKLVHEGMLWVKRKEYQGIVNQNLHDVIPFDIHELTPMFFGILGKSSGGYSIYNWSGHQSSYFQNVNLHEPWVTVEKNNGWYLFNPESHKLSTEEYDSLKFEGPFVLGINENTLTIHFTSNGSKRFIQPVIASFIPGKDSTSFLMVEEQGKKTIFNQRGTKLFNGIFEQIQYAGQDLFVVSKKEKKGLVDASGKILLPLEFDAIGSVNNSVISLLKNLKFGLYHVETQKLIKPQYDKNLSPYTQSLISAFRDGFYGFIQWDNKPDGKFEFEEIQYWNDTTALVKKNFLWKLQDLKSKEIIESDIKGIKMIKDSPDEKLAIVKKGNSFGVLSSKRGTVIPLSFSDIVNLGSSEEPLYFTEKHVEEAAVFVVIYYNSHGKMLRREVYEEAEDYEKIYCSDN